MLVQLITAPALEPVTLAEAKIQLQLEHALDDSFITGIIVAARTHLELVCWRGFVTQTWERVMDRWPGEAVGDGALLSSRQQTLEVSNGIELPKGNLVSITSVKYIDGNGAEQTLATSEYVADLVNVPGRARLAYDKEWPTHRTQWDAIKVRYVVGWAVAAVPQQLKQAVLLLVSQMYENRTPEITGTIVSKVEFSVDALISSYRLVRHT